MGKKLWMKDKYYNNTYDVSNSYQPLIYTLGGFYMFAVVVAVIIFLAGVGGVIALIVYGSTHWHH